MADNHYNYELRCAMLAQFGIKIPELDILIKEQKGLLNEERQILNDLEAFN